MKNRVAYENQNVYLKINIDLNQASTLSFRPVLPLYRNHPLIYEASIIGMVSIQWQHWIETS